MKKISLVVAFIIGCFTAQAQNTGLEIGLKISPSLTGQRIVSPGGFGIVKQGAKARFGLGIVADYFFGENYAFNTGVEFATKGAGVTYNEVKKDNSSANAHITSNREIDEFNVQFLQIPIGLKLFTNEVATDMRVYFQVGTSLNFRLASKVNDEKFYSDYMGDNVKTNKRFNIFEADAVIGSGVEYQLGSSTKVFGGLSYHHGLTDMDNYYEDYYKPIANNSNDIAIKNYTIALDLGIKF